MNKWINKKNLREHFPSVLIPNFFPGVVHAHKIDANGLLDGGIKGWSVVLRGNIRTVAKN